MQLVIGGELVNGHGTDTDPVLNPASEEVLADVPSATVEDVFAAVDAARAAGPSWGSTSRGVLAIRRAIFASAWRSRNFAD